MKVYDLDTPSLVIDLPKMERNLQSMADKCRIRNIKLRPHIKTHKISEIALRQINLSQNGIAVSKLGEAEVMIKSGITDILVANQIIGEQKISRLISLLDKADIKVCVDSVEGIEQLQNYLSLSNHCLKVLIEIDTGMNRCGVFDDNVIAMLVESIDHSPNLSFEGFMSHSGNIYGSSNKEECKKIALREASRMSGLATYWRTKGYSVNSVSIGSTPAAAFLDEISGITEYRPGNYVFYDIIQVKLGGAEVDDCALSVLATVISKPAIDRVVIDAGSKCLGLDRGAHSKQLTSGYGYVKEYPDAIIDRLSEEHGILKVNDSRQFRIGEKITIIPNHACAVTNLFDEAFVTNGDEVIDTWRIAARGKVR